MDYMHLLVKEKVKKSTTNRKTSYQIHIKKTYPYWYGQQELNQNSDNISQKKGYASLLKGKNVDEAGGHVQITQNKWEKHEFDNRNFTDFK